MLSYNYSRERASEFDDAYGAEISLVEEEVDERHAVNHTLARPIPSKPRATLAEENGRKNSQTEDTQPAKSSKTATTVSTTNSFGYILVLVGFTYVGSF